MIYLINNNNNNHHDNNNNVCRFGIKVAACFRCFFFLDNIFYIKYFSIMTLNEVFLLETS